MSSVKSARRVPSPKAKKKKKLITNTFELIQVKKMIGKGLIVPYKGADLALNQELKNKILSKAIKSIAMTGFLSGGIIYIFEGVDRLTALNAVSYADIKKVELEIEIYINQYSSLADVG
jgi:hypothetical protein